MGRMKWDRARKRGSAGLDQRKPRELTVRKKPGGPPCPKCGCALEIREHARITDTRLRQPYYYSRWFFCRNSRCSVTTYMSDEFKIVRPEPKAALPEGWHFSRREGRVVTADGVVVPLVDHPLVGGEAERAAYRQLLNQEASAAT